jgi:hypothetical protein
MHRLIQDHLEEVLAEVSNDTPAAKHLTQCEDCRREIAAMRGQASLIQQLRAPELAPKPGFYARVMERIDAQRPVSIWQLFFDSAFVRRIAMASMAMALLFTLYLVSSERYSPEPVTVSMDAPDGMTLSQAGLPDRDAVLLNLVTYREQ